MVAESSRPRYTPTRWSPSPRLHSLAGTPKCVPTRKGYAMPSPNNWLLIDVLDPRHPTVVAVGARTRSRVALSSFIRAWDRDLVMAAVMKACRHGTSVHANSGSRAVAVDPIADEVTGLVHGVWLRVTHRSADPIDRPSAWAFEWNLDTGVARRCAIVSDTETWAKLGVEQNRPISDGLAKLDLGSTTASVLANLVSGSHGTLVQQTAVEQRPFGGPRIIQFTARFVTEPMNSSDQTGNRLVRGISVDLGAVQTCEHAEYQASSLGDRIALSLSSPREYRAIADPDSLRLLYWYGDAPEDIAWRNAHVVGAKPVLHPEDAIHAAVTAKLLKSSPFGTTKKLNLRFLTHQDGYTPISVTARAIDLDDRSRALLLTLHPKTDE